MPKAELPDARSAYRSSKDADMTETTSLGIDIGGTFTDLVIHCHTSGQRHALKVLTTHDDPRRGAMSGIATLLRTHAIAPGSIARVVHATTLFTNALIERKGAATGVITTAGFRDTLEIGRERKYALYDLGIELPAPLVPRDLRLEVSERCRADGSVLRALEAGELRAAVDTLRARNVGSVAILFLHAYANPAHEQEAARLIGAYAPELFVTTSHEVAPEIREYDRFSTTVASAYIKPLAVTYLRGLDHQLADVGITAPLLLMISSGGLTHIDEVTANPVQMLESGPAAGALAAAFFGARDGDADLLAFDMGGTTAKLSLIEAGEPLIAYGFEAARQKRFMEGSGLPIRISTVELIEIGAGGGSIARRDELGLLKVGPDSAGSEPGPACYALGGTQPTVTDANLLLGYLNPDFFAGGTLTIDPVAAAAAVAGLADAVGMATPQVAAGIHDVVNEAMASAARVHIAERGRDPRGYALLVTGGGGPVHGYGVARKLGLSRLICPPSPGVASAWGLLVAPARVDRVTTVGFRLRDGDVEALEAAFQRLEAEAKAVLAETGLPPDAAQMQRMADGRFIGQGFDLAVKLPPGPYAGEDVRARLTAAFEDAYREKFTRAPPDVPLEFIAARVAAQVAIPGGHIAALPEDVDATKARRGVRRAWFAEAGGFVDAVVYDRERLGAGATFAGPALVEDAGSTLVVGPGGTCRVTAQGSIIMQIGQEISDAR
jgi:N-methylhydantoinase A